MSSWTDTQITAIVEDIRFPKTDPETPGEQFYILRTDLGTVKGRLSHRPRKGEALQLEGKWEPSKYNGSMEFSFFRARVNIPEDSRALLRYACEMTTGLGPALEERIWETLGPDWKNLAEDADIRGLTPRLVRALRETLDNLALHETESRTMSWLIGLGLTFNLARVAWTKWQAKTIELVTADCYILAELPHYSFRTVDTQLRHRFKLADNDLRRISACIRYFLGQLTESDTVADWSVLCDLVVKTIGVAPQAVSDHCRDLIAKGRLVPFPKSRRLAKTKDYAAEAAIAAYVSTPRHVPACKARQVPGRLFDLDATQMAAVQYALDHHFAIINGGAGCGKTSLVQAIIHSLGSTDIELCAFAGKAAARLREATGHEAGTIHRMLGYKGEEVGFTRKSLEGVTVIVDEASMVHSELLGAIIKRAPARLILVGDEAQIPPVGSGQPFHDLIRLAPDSVRTLATCYRNREAVFAAANAIRQGGMPPAYAKSEAETWEMISKPDERAAHQFILDRVRNGEVDFDTDIILCCRNGEENDLACSVAGLNRDIKDLVNPNEDGSCRLAPGDRVICTRNNAEKDVWNGTTGRVKSYDHCRAMWVALDFPRADGTRLVIVEKEEVKDWTLAYALTVHKSQGSQYRRVFFACARRDLATPLSRAMVYTAVTRTREACTVVGDLKTLRAAISKVEHKHTVMQEIYNS